MDVNSKKMKHCLFTLSGWLFLWVVLGNVLGEILVLLSDGHGTCYPQKTWGGYETQCENTMATIGWLLLVGIPGLAIEILATCFGFFILSIKTLSADHFFSSLHWLMFALPMMLFMITGFLYCKKRSAPIAIALLCLMVSQVTYLAIHL